MGGAKRKWEEYLERVVPVKPNMVLNLAPFDRWTLRDKAAQSRLAH